MQTAGVSQSELARMVGRSAKHVNRVFNGHAGTHEMDYWAWVLGLEYHVTLIPHNGDVP